MDGDTHQEYYFYGNENYTDNDSIFDITPCEPQTLSGSEFFLPTIYFLIFLTGFFGNLFVIFVVQSKKRGSRLVDTFVINLAVADLVFVVSLPLWAISASQKNYWNFGNFLCKLSSYIIAVNRFSNIFFLTCMSIDRYLAVVKLMDSKYLRSSWCVWVTCAVIWGISLVLGIPSLIYRKMSYDGKICTEDINSTFFLGTNLIMALLTFIFPVFIIVLCYGNIIMHLNKHSAAAGNPRADARRKHSLKIVLCIIVAFVVSWLPYNVFKSIIVISHLTGAELSCETESWQLNGLTISCCLAFLNSCVNPAIYFFLDHHFRRSAETMYKTCLRKPKLLQSFNSSASFTNGFTSESNGTTNGRSQFQMA
ncbi:probable G-protein coupled receptor 25 [Archocentrus centrarchus]|uniref:probable G-protein coupled receptor 25 n=1 Tax=Archocentrus centrarchus TaxID=63155 RepID=UPI0011EA11C7|nr:probable G-protein coupled receptor 25 [Archocentrus centrarchus]XP_030586219.1 probable G-protein coupled receptor 25 [Archocentrus centrarchus]